MVVLEEVVDIGQGISHELILIWSTMVICSSVNVATCLSVKPITGTRTPPHVVNGGCHGLTICAKPITITQTPLHVARGGRRRLSTQNVASMLSSTFSKITFIAAPCTKNIQSSVREFWWLFVCGVKKPWICWRWKIRKQEHLPLCIKREYIGGWVRDQTIKLTPTSKTKNKKQTENRKKKCTEEKRYSACRNQTLKPQKV